MLPSYGIPVSPVVSWGLRRRSLRSSQTMSSLLSKKRMKISPAYFSTNGTLKNEQNQFGFYIYVVTSYIYASSPFKTKLNLVPPMWIIIVFVSRVLLIEQHPSPGRISPSSILKEKLLVNVHHLTMVCRLKWLIYNKKSKEY